MNRNFKLGIKILISAGIIYYIITIIPLPSILENLITVKIRYLLAGLLIIQPAIFYLAAMQMQILTKQQQLSLSVWQIIEINIVTTFYNLFLPGYISGGAIRWYKFAKTDQKPAEALAVIIYNRLLNTLIIIFLGFFFLTLDDQAQAGTYMKIVMAILMLGLIAALFLVFNSKTAGFFTHLLNKIKVVPRLIAAKLTKLIEAIQTFQSVSLGNNINMVFLTGACHLLGALFFWLFALSLGIKVSFISLGWIRSVIMLILMMPISFSGLGVREGGLIVLLQQYGVAAEEAIAFSLLLLCRTILLGAIGGLLELKRLFTAPAP